MDTQPTNLESLFEKAEAYSIRSLELVKLKSVERISEVASWVTSRLGVVITISLFAFSLNIGIALWLGELLGKIYYGFFIVAAFYLLVGLVLHLFLHQWIKKPLGDLIIKKALQ